MKSNKDEYRSLGDCIELIIDHRGKTPKKLGSEWVEKGVPTLSAKNVFGGKLVAQNSIRYVTFEVYKKWMKEDVKRGDCFLVSEGATLGERLYWDYDYPVVLGQRIFCIRTNPAVLYSRYFYAYMNSKAFQAEILGRATGSSVSGLRQTEVLKLRVKILPMTEQVFIGDILYNINTKIQANSEINQTLEEMAQAIFKSWFVDFEPVKAKIEANANGQDPERAAMCAISGKTDAELDQLPSEQLAQLHNTAALFPDELTNSEIGPIPAGWNERRIDSILELAYGKALKKTNRIPGHVPVYGSGGVNGFHNKHLVEGPGIIVGRKGTVGSLHWENDDFFPIDTVFYVAPKGDFSLEYIFYLLQTLGLQNMNTDAAVPGLNRNNVYSLLVAGHPKEFVEIFSNVVRSFSNKMSQSKKENESLVVIRDTLLPKLLSGEITVKGAEFVIKEGI